MSSARLKPKRPKAKRTLNLVERADVSVARATALDGRTRVARRIDAIADLGDQPPLRILCGLVIAAGLARRDYKLVRTGLRMLAAHSVATGVKGIIKHRIDRTRPNDALRNARYKLDTGRSRESRLSSMPSGHTAGVASVARAIAREYPAAAPVADAAALAVVLAQLPAKNHFVSDLAVGSIIGIASEAVVSRLMAAVAGRD